VGGIWGSGIGSVGWFSGLFGAFSYSFTCWSFSSHISSSSSGRVQWPYSSLKTTSLKWKIICFSGFHIRYPVCPL
jgi:hypothetical protein